MNALLNEELVINIKDSAMSKWKNNLGSDFQFASYTPIVFLSTKTKKRIYTLMHKILSFYENCKEEVKTSLLNEVMIDAYSLNLSSSYKGKYIFKL